MGYIHRNFIIKVLPVIFFLFLNSVVVSAQPPVKKDVIAPIKSRTSISEDGKISKYISEYPSCDCIVDTAEIEYPDGTFEMLFSARSKNNLRKDTVETLIAGRKNLTIDVYENLEEMPKYKNGSDDLKRYVESNLKFNNDGKRYVGTIVMNFIVRDNGKIQNVMFDNTYTKYPEELEKDINRILKNMPAWTPGMLNRKAVNGYYYYRMQLVI